jgi:carboxypeptidase Taq
MNGMSVPQAAYDQYKQQLQKIADIKYACAVLQWDQETYMPGNGATFRARQIATLSELAHSIFVAPEFKALLIELQSKDGLTESQQKNVALSWYDFTQQEKLPASFVRKLSEAVSTSFQSWINARKENNFQLFQKDLTYLVALKKEETDWLGYNGHPYNALLNQYERGCTVQMVDGVFSSLQQPLKQLLDIILGKPAINDGFLKQYFPKDVQWKFGMEVLAKLGFDFESGRQDISEHPFTTNFSNCDVRITTRIDENDFSNMIWSCIHECGHALYEQGLPSSEYGLPLGEYTSLSIHESQSRLWENNIGRSSEAWQYFYPLLYSYFPEQLKGIETDNFYRSINKVAPSFIRTEADELTYHFHVLIRYNLEKALLSDAITVSDIPAYWNEQYYKLLGLKVPDDRNGCLQDVHWCHGSFGYFPTYSLGSFYAAQFFNTACLSMPELEQQIRNGSFQPLLNWLRSNIHQHGRTYTSEQLCERISGEPLNITYYLEQVREKYKNIYNF